MLLFDWLPGNVRLKCARMVQVAVCAQEPEGTGEPEGKGEPEGSRHTARGPPLLPLTVLREILLMLILIFLTYTHMFVPPQFRGAQFFAWSSRLQIDV